MPFTTSHPAIVLPLKQFQPNWFSLTGLMAGAMSPDLLYFLLLDTTHRGWSHSWTGLFVFCLPAGLIFSFAFHRLFKFHFIANLPRPVDRFLSGLAVKPFKVINGRDWLILIFSVLVGALSHFFWDSFTHQQGEIARRIPFLLERHQFMNIVIPNYRIVQHLSTISGAVYIVIFSIKSNLLPAPAFDFQPRKFREKITFWIAAVLPSLVFTAIMILLFYQYDVFHPDRRLFVFPISTTVGLSVWAGFFYTVAVYTLIIRYLSPKKPALQS